MTRTRIAGLAAVLVLGSVAAAALLRGVSPNGLPDLNGTTWEGTFSGKIYDQTGVLPLKGVKGKTPITIDVTQAGSDVTLTVDFPIEPFGPFALTGEIGNYHIVATGTTPTGTPLQFSAHVNPTSTSLKGAGALLLGPTDLLGVTLFLVLDGKVKAKRL
ncbi:MAG: hypothetical protein ACREIU_03960 [Planctomycetota bacterium]